MRDVNNRSREYLKKKPNPKMPLHQYIALGGDPKKREGCQGVTPQTVPGYKGGRKG